ncbi:hypothetical protein [[Clostridium] dakarense]|uniref:hypothetical protein n=1 Tax=Faecalimicrobium dakarense TaxID=1301100 RepID=UPI0004BBE531|nr:hypothetical protein [[Clostridium] dakarense]
MKKVLIGTIVLLAIGVVGCGSGDSTTNKKEIVLTEEEVSQIIDSRESTGEEYNATIKYLANQMKEAQEDYAGLIEKNESKEDIFIAMNEYRDKLMNIEKSIQDIHIGVMDIEEKEGNNSKDNYFLLVDLKKYYSGSLDYEINYVKNEDSNGQDKAKEELEKALQKYEEISNL